MISQWVTPPGVFQTKSSSCPIRGYLKRGQGLRSLPTLHITVFPLPFACRPCGLPPFSVSPCRFSSIGCGCPYASPFFPLSGFGALFRLLPPFFPFSGPHSCKRLRDDAKQCKIVLLRYTKALDNDNVIKCN